MFKKSVVVALGMMLLALPSIASAKMDSTVSFVGQIPALVSVARLGVLRDAPDWSDWRYVSGYEQVGLEYREADAPRGSVCGQYEFRGPVGTYKVVLTTRDSINSPWREVKAIIRIYSSSRTASETPWDRYVNGAERDYE